MIFAVSPLLNPRLRRKLSRSSSWRATICSRAALIPATNGAGIRAAREQIVARQDEERESFLRKRGFSKGETAKIIATVLEEEGRPPESVFDFVQGITALARGKPHQDARLELEGKAKLLLERAA